MYIIQGINRINANIRGNKTVQQYDINWSKRTLGNEALTHMKTKIRMKVFKAIIRLGALPSNHYLNFQDHY